MSALRFNKLIGKAYAISTRVREHMTHLTSILQTKQREAD